MLKTFERETWLLFIKTFKQSEFFLQPYELSSVGY